MFGMGFYNNFITDDKVYVLIIETDGNIRYHVFRYPLNLRNYIRSRYYDSPNDMNRIEAEAVMNLDKSSFSFNQFLPNGETSKVTITVRTAPFTQ